MRHEKRPASSSKNLRRRLRSNVPEDRDAALAELERRDEFDNDLEYRLDSVLKVACKDFDQMNPQPRPVRPAKEWVPAAEWVPVSTNVAFLDALKTTHFAVRHAPAPCIPQVAQICSAAAAAALLAAVACCAAPANKKKTHRGVRKPRSQRGERP